MSNCSIKNIVKIIQGSYKKFSVTLEDQDTGERIDLTTMTTGKIIILRGVGTKLEKAVTMPPLSPKLGVVDVELLAAETATLDKDTKSFELEISDGTKTYVYQGENLLEVKERL